MHDWFSELPGRRSGTERTVEQHAEIAVFEAEDTGISRLRKVLSRGRIAVARFFTNARDGVACTAGESVSVCTQKSEEQAIHGGTGPVNIR